MSSRPCLSLAAAVLGATRALREVVELAPAVAMQPPAPPRFRQLLPAGFALDRLVSQPTMMMLRNIARHPVRAAFTMLGMALATAILIVSLFTRDTMEQLIDVTYFLADRQDATVELRREAAAGRRHADGPAAGRARGRAVSRGAGADPQRQRRAPDHRSAAGRPTPISAASSMSTCGPSCFRRAGLAISEHARADPRRAASAIPSKSICSKAQRRTVSLPVPALVEDYFGIRGMMDADALARLMREAPAVNSVNLSLDESRREAFYAAVKAHADR